MAAAYRAVSAQPLPLPVGYVGYWTDEHRVVHQTRAMAPGESRMVYGLTVVCGYAVAMFEHCTESAAPTCLWCVGHVDYHAVPTP